MKRTAAHLVVGLALFVCGLAAAGCGGARARSGPSPRGTVRFDVTPKDAGVEVDEQRLGPAEMFEEHGVLLRPGQHRVILRHPDYFPEHRLIEVTEDEVVVVAASLRPIPP